MNTTMNAHPAQLPINKVLVGDAELTKDLHGADVEVGRFRMGRSRGMLLHQHAIYALAVQVQCRGEANGTTTDDEHLGFERSHFAHHIASSGMLAQVWSRWLTTCSQAPILGSS